MTYSIEGSSRGEAERVLGWLGRYIHAANVAAGWWDNVPDDKYTIPTKIALAHSELSEALEGFRKGLMDDHLPHRPMDEVEYADAIIRILDICGRRNLDIGGALVEKFNYNQTRADHKPEAREAEGGKKDMTQRPRLLILGNARHGKDTACEWLRDNHGYRFVSSSWFMCERVVMPAFAAAGRPYESAEACYADRMGRRQFWYEAIAAFNANDPSRLTREIFAAGYDIYAGCRNRREVWHGKLAKAFDLIVYIDASERVPPEASTSCNIGPHDADVVVDNNGTIADLHRNLALLWSNWLRPHE